MGQIKTIKLSEHGMQLGPRLSGIILFKSALDHLGQDPENTVEIDATGVDILSTGFARELYGGLWLALKEKFFIRVSIIIPEDNASIQASIIRGIKSAMGSNGPTTNQSA